MSRKEALRELRRLFRELYATDWSGHPESLAEHWVRIHVANLQTRGLR